MKSWRRVKESVVHSFSARSALALMLVCSASRASAQTNVAITVRHAPAVNGGRIEGSLQELLGETFVINGGAVLTGDVLVPGTPTVKLNGKPVFGGVVPGTGASTPTGYTVTLNGGVTLRYVRTRTDPVSLSVVTAPPTPTGTRAVTVTARGQSVGSFSTLKNLTLNGNVGLYSIPAGTYGNFTANAGGGFVLGVAGATLPAIYNLQNLTLNGCTEVRVAGPIILTVANGVTLNGAVGDTNHPAWLQLRAASGGVTLNAGSSLGALLAAPSGTVTINGNSILAGSSVCDRFILNSGGLVRWAGAANQAPSLESQTVTTIEDVAVPVALRGTDPDGDALTYSIVSLPSHGHLSGAAPMVTYTPNQNFNGSDSFSFRVNDGQTDSPAATVNVTVRAVNDPPSFVKGADQQVDEDSGPQAITGWAATILAGPSDESNQQLNFVVTNDNPSLFASPPSLSPGGTMTFTPAANAFGLATVTIRLHDEGGTADGGIDTSAPQIFTITVKPVNDPPTVAIVAPAPGSSFDEGTLVPVSVTAADIDGAITRVVLLVDGEPVGESQGSPFQFAWNAGAVGPHLLVAVAYDNDGAATTSAPVSASILAAERGPIVVDAGSDQIISLPDRVALAGALSVPDPIAGVLTNVVWSSLSGPGPVTFSPSDALRTQAGFAAPGTYILRLTVSYAESRRSDTLTAVVLAAPSQQPPSVRSHRGTDFWLTFLENYQLSSEPRHYGLNLVVTSEADTTGTVTIPEDGTVTTRHFSVKAGGAAVVPVTDYGGGSGLRESDVIRTNAIHVTAASEISVYALNYLDATSDGYTALPTALLGTEYIALGYKNTTVTGSILGEQGSSRVIGGTQFAIVATEDDTGVTITPSADSGSRTRGLPYGVTLNRGETYRLIEETNGQADFTGTLIAATKPVAVFAGHKCALVPGNSEACDHLVEQLPPVTAWGRRFVTVPLATRRNGDTFRILAARDSTVIAVNGQLAARLDRGQFLERIIDGPAEILASEPVLVAQYANGSEFDNLTGDPFMMLVPSVEQFGADYTFATPRLFDYWEQSYSDVFDSYLNLTIRTEDITAVMLDGSPVASGLFAAIGGSGYSGGQVHLVPGVHHVTAPVPFGASIYGWADFESYAYMGGMFSESVEADTRLTLTQATSFAAVGMEKVIVALVTNGRGRPLADIGVTFSISGANPSQTVLRTSRFGEATLSYVGTHAGVDVIMASVAGLQRPVTNEWLSAGSNHPPVVDAGANRLINFGETAQLSATVADDGLPAGGELTVNWRVVSGPDEVGFDDATRTTTLASFDLPGVYLLELTASDSQFSTRSFVTVTVNSLPDVQLGGGFPEVVEVGEMLTILAQASDFDGAITRVELFEGETKIAESVAPGQDDVYSFEWIVSSSGIHRFTAVALDDRGGAGRSNPISVRGNAPPSVAFTSPADGAILDARSPVQFTVEAADPDGAAVAVYYLANGEYLGEGLGPMFSLLWTPGMAGVYSIQAAAVDGDGFWAYSSERQIEIRAPVPTVVLNTTLPDPVRGSIAGFPLVLAAAAQVTAPYEIDRVEFFAGAQTIGVVTNWPFEMLYTPTNPGAQVFVARAYTGFGSSADSAPVSVQSVPHLEVGWENVVGNEWVPLGVPKRLVLRVEDPGGIFDSAAFLVNGVTLEETAFPYADWTPAVTGGHLVQARVSDVFGNNYLTDAVSVRVAELHPPQVRIVTPANGDRFAPGSSISVEAEATDVDGVVTNLTLTRFNAPDATSINGSLTHVWTDLPPGEHTLTAVATDDTGQSSETTVHVIVERPFNSSLLPPQGLAAESLGCNAVRVTWAPPSGASPEIIVVERAEEPVEVWAPMAFVPADQTEIRDHYLRPATRYRYRAYSKNANEERSVNSVAVETRTRMYLPRFATLDLAGSLVDSGTLAVASSDAPSASAPLRRVRLDLHRAQNSFLPVSPEYLSGLIPLGLSDNNRVLMVNGISSTDTRTFLWRPDGQHQQYDRAAFEPNRLALPGVPVGTRLTVVHDSEGREIRQYHAGLWVDEFLDFTPDVSALRLPEDHDPLVEPYATGNLLADVNVAGVSVGRATWTYFESDDPDSHLLLPPVLQATLWTGLGQRGIPFGALELLNNESEFLAINDAGDIVGISRLFDELRPEVRVTHAVRSSVSLVGATGNKLTDIGTLGGSFSAALSINRSGWAAGYSTLHPDDPVEKTRAVFWQPDDTSPRQLPGFTDDLKTYGWAINDAYWIVGDAMQTNGQQCAALWTPGSSVNPEADFDLSNLNERLSSSDWLLVSARYLNRAGFISGQGLHVTTVVVDGVPEVQAAVPRAYLLVPNVSLAVDYNRDGRIELNEKDDLPKDIPWQFWVNDDADSGEEASGKSDVPGARSGPFEFDGRDPNYADDRVNGACDLPDWFPVYLNITNLMALLPPGVNEYRLVQADDALNFVYTDLRPDEAGRYLTNALNNGFGPDFNQASASAGCLRVTAEGVALSPVFLQKIQDEGKGVLLFEARQATEQPLRLEVWNGHRLAAAVELPLKISGVEDMYGWVNLRGVAGQTPQRLSNYLHPANEPESSREDRRVVFVHGYNVNEQESRGWTAEMFKRLWWSGSNARFYGVSWHGDESQVLGVSVNFQANVLHAFASAPALASFVNGLARQGDVTLIGHSLGNMLASAAIQDEGARPARFFMVDAAVALEAYVPDAEPAPNMTNPKWKNYESRLFASEWYKLFPSDDGRSTLTWRGRFGDVVKDTRVYNYYSSGEEVLKNMDLQINTVLGGLTRGAYDYLTGVTGSYAWGLQETLKGTGLTGYFLSSSYGGWGFNPDWGQVVEGENSAPPIHILLSPDEAAALPDSILRTKPFFLPGPDGLYLPTGGLYALDNRTQLLDEMFPARTFAAGANRLSLSRERASDKLAQAEIDMNSSFQNGWPQGRLSKSDERYRWFHSDLKGIAFPFNYGLYRQWVEFGALR